jgi:hypothetical protein
MYALVSNRQIKKYPYSFGQLQADNPQISFPAEMPSNRLAEFGLVPVEPTPRPEEDHTKTFTEGQPQLIDGKWTQVWVVEDAPSELVAQRTSDQAAEIRQERNALLAVCDWTQLADAPVDSLGWAVYRQELRDITQQNGFPWNVVWPNKPE